MKYFTSKKKGVCVGGGALIRGRHALSSKYGICIRSFVSAILKKIYYFYL